MRVYVTDHSNDKEKLYEGTAAHVESRLLFDYPFLRSDNVEDRGNLEAVLDRLDATAYYQVHVEEDGDDGLTKSEPDIGPAAANSEVAWDQCGYSLDHAPALAAAKFMAGGLATPKIDPRKAFWENDGDPRAAALQAYGLEVNETNIRTLEAIESMNKLVKTEGDGAGLPTAKSVVAYHHDDDDVAEQISRAFRDKFVFEVMLSGKHSNGTLLAHDNDSHTTWLLKPGSGGQSGAAGAAEDPASQACREAGFYQVAKMWGLYKAIPRAALLIIDGQQYAAFPFLAGDYKTLGKLRHTDHNIAQRVFLPHLNDGTLHQWAALYFIAGESDGHEQNAMLNKDDDVKLIDHGAAFAGPHFDPAHDKNSFVPCFLRAWAPRAFNSLSTEEKLSYLPRVSESVRTTLMSWLNGIHAAELEHTLYRYGINPSASLARLAALKTLSTEMPIDAAINRLWVTV